MNLPRCVSLNYIFWPKQQPYNDHFQASLENAEELGLQPGLCCFIEAQSKTINTLIN